MKKRILFGVLFAALSSVSLFAQAPTTALDFTQTDCDGLEHHLYSELEAGKVILLEFAMSCASCENARILLEDLEADFSLSHPDRFQIYIMSYTNSTNCEKMKAWPVVKNFMSPAFVGVADQLEYYGGFGMPTLVVVGGKDHTIYYLNNKGIPTSQRAAEMAKIKEAVTQALTTAEVQAPPGKRNGTLAVYPNPAHNTISVTLPRNSTHAGWEQEYEVRILNLLGVEVMRHSGQVVDNLELDISALEPGMYLFSLNTAAGPDQRVVFLKQ